MKKEVSWVVGGQQGEGIDSTGEILAAALNRLGYHIYGYRTFSSRIKGGHTNYTIRISTERVVGNAEKIDILLAFDQDSITRLGENLAKGAIVITDADGKVSIPAELGINHVAVPMTQISKDLGNTLMKNTVGLGVSAALMGLGKEDFAAIIKEQFERKGEKVVNLNTEAFMKGYQFIKDANIDLSSTELLPGDGKRRYMMSGNEAAGFGALVGGCRFLAAYPITPASEIMQYLIKEMPNYHGAAIQVEDEIASLIMAIGAGYTGVRSMTSTSGPGLSLMMEALGYAGMTESPVVIIDVQRAGPSTGMATKHEQSDLYEMVYGSHGDLARIVLTPGTVEEVFYDTALAFNLAEKYQVPVIVALDMALGLCKQTVEVFDFDTINIDRGQVMTEEELEKLGSDFKRYLLTENGVSPRSLPGQKHGLYLATGVEHDPSGHIFEGRENRVKMVDKRFKKLEGAAKELKGHSLEYLGSENPDLLTIGWGGTKGQLTETYQTLKEEGYNVAHLHFRAVSPFPKEQVQAYIYAAKKVLIVENNSSGQLGNIIAQAIDIDRNRVQKLLKYDGNPFIAAEIISRCREVL